MSLRAVRLNEKGRRLMDAGDLDLAAARFQEAVDRDPRYGAAWFNLGLVYKQQRAWEACLEANQRAVGLAKNLHDNPACWNGGIAATALGHWSEARELWVQYGVDVPEGDGPIEMDIGITPVRIDPAGNGEVVWCTRLDPARARIDNIPTPESGHRWRDVVLHDGVPNGERTFQGRTFSVFDEIERWGPSPTPTLTVVSSCSAAEDSEELEAIFGRAGWAAEDWTGSINLICQACSEGRPHEGHGDRPAGAPWSADRRFGLAAPIDVAENLLSEWMQAAPGSRSFGSPEVAT